MKFKQIVLSVLFTSLVVALGIIVFRNYSQHSPQALSHSPSGQYEVAVTKDIDPISSLLPETLFRFSVKDSGSSFVSREYLKAFDSFQMQFSHRYDDIVWISDRALRFGNNNTEITLRESKTLTLRIRNTTGQVIKYVVVDVGDLYLILNIPPGDSFCLDLPISYRSLWMNVRGASIGGDVFEVSGSLSEPIMKGVELVVKVDPEGASISLEPSKKN